MSEQQWAHGGQAPVSLTHTRTPAERGESWWWLGDPRLDHAELFAVFSLCFNFRMLKHSVKQGRVGHKLLIWLWPGLCTITHSLCPFFWEPWAWWRTSGDGAEGGLATGLRSCLKEQAAHLLCPQSPAHQSQRALTATSLLGEKRRKRLFCVFPQRSRVIDCTAAGRAPGASPGHGSTAGVIIPLFSCLGLGEKLGKLPLVRSVRASAPALSL